MWRRADTTLSKLANATQEMHLGANDTNQQESHQVLVNTVGKAVVQEMIQLVGFAVEESAGESHFVSFCVCVCVFGLVVLVDKLAQHSHTHQTTFSVFQPAERSTQSDNSQTQTEKDNQETLDVVARHLITAGRAMSGFKQTKPMAIPLAFCTHWQTRGRIFVSGTKCLSPSQYGLPNKNKIEEGLEVKQVDVTYKHDETMATFQTPTG